MFLKTIQIVQPELGKFRDVFLYYFTLCELGISCINSFIYNILILIIGTSVNYLIRFFFLFEIHVNKETR